jgi:hypothetical protein
MENRLHVRYGRLGDLPKNTLVTLRDGDTIYFGIARCRLTMDMATKEEGKRWASYRALQAATDKNLLADKNIGEMDGTLLVHRDGLLGKVHVESVEKLLNYFDNIDEIQLSKLSSR